MKRLHYFLFAIVLFMSFTTGVEANTKCVYDWNDIRFVLETDEGGSTLNKVTTNPDYDFDLYQGGISLNRGACPRISIIDTSILFGFSSWRRIYPTREACVEDNGNRGNEECSQLVGGTRSLNDESTESLLGLEGQFDLVGSSANTCNYSYESTDVNIDLDITKDGNSLRYICHSDQTDTCNPTANDEVENAILNNGNFTCPPYLYASNIKVTGIISTNFDLTGVGTEDDENTSSGSSWQRPNAVSGDNWDKTVDCPDLFSDEPGSVGNILRTILGYIRVIGPILVVLLSAIDFIKAIFGFDEKAMTNAYRKLIIRLIAAIALFLIPTLIDVMLDFINATTCTLE